MAVEDHPLFTEYSVARERLLEAEHRFTGEVGKSGEAAARRDLELAQAEFDAIAAKVGS